MASIKINIVANLIGRLWGALIGILLIPQYIKFLGIESYGLVGFYGTLIGSMALLDLGLSTTVNRELAKFNLLTGINKKIRDLVFSLECIYWLIGLFICIVIVCLSPFIATSWVKIEHLPLTTVQHAILMMGIVVAFQWPISLYDGGLTGLNKQVLNNNITILMSTLRAGGVIVILKYISPTLEAFFIWQAALSCIYVLVMRWALWRAMPKADARLIFSKEELKKVWRFAAGMTGISIVTFLLMQIDKIILSKLLSLSNFAYYTLAFTLASSIGLIIGPISVTFFPRFSSLVASDNKEELKRLYHQACRLMSTFIFPIGFILLFFIKDILLIWTKNDLTTANTYLMARILIIGSMLNALMVIPYNLIIANGWTKFTIYQNLVAAIILVPMLFIWTNWYGAIGATFVWLIVNAGYVLISQPIMHRKLLKTELIKWYWNDCIIPMLPSLATVLIAKIILQTYYPNTHLNIFLIGGISIITFIVSLLSMHDARSLIKKMLQNLRVHAK